MRGLISAIVPTFDRADFLVECVQALQSQTRPLHQIIVFSDGSSDHTDEVMAKMSGTNETQFLYLSHENAGKSATLNKAMAHATGEYIWVCDDDDLVLPNAAAELGAVLDETNAGMVAARHNRFSIDDDTGKKTVIDTGYWPNLNQGSVLRHLLEDIFFFQPGTLVRRKAYETVGPFRENLKRSIDYEMFVRLAAKFPAVVIDKVLFEQRKHDGDRGAGAARHLAAESEIVWKANDKAIFGEFRDVLPLTLYQAFFDSPDDVLRQRAALLQRGCVYARRSDWGAAQDDFRAALSLSPNTPLTATEHAIAVRALAGKHGSSDAFVQPTLHQLLAFKHAGAAGRSFCRALARGAVWRLRQALTHGHLLQAAHIVRFMIGGGLPSRPPQDENGHKLSERKVLPQEAYAW